MNKLMGLFELNDLDLPSIPWEVYTGKENLDKELLWTIRSAVFSGDDLNLPRLVGATAAEAKKFADKLSFKLKDKGIVIFYPFFIAEKSGTLEVRNNRIIIEAVKDDLWNLVTYSKKDVTIIIDDENINYDGNEKFLTTREIKEILKYVPNIKYMFRDFLTEGKSILFEWSYAYNTNDKKKMVGKEYLVFYEVRTV